MPFHLADYQQDVYDKCCQQYDNGAEVIAPIMPTGTGKTVLMGHDAHMHDGYGFSMAHRNELVGQISMALAREGMRHDIVASNTTIKNIVKKHMDEFGASFYNQRATWKVGSVDTIIRRDLPDSWLRQVTKIHIDEGHHVLQSNKWGIAYSRFTNPNKRGMTPTAMPERADGQGIARIGGAGFVDALVVGPNMRWAIDEGHLTDYQIHGVKTSDFTMDGVEISPETGDYKQDQMRRRTKESKRRVGDIVATYLKWAPGLKGITFAVDVEDAETIAKAYNAAGVKAAVVHAKTPEAIRDSLLREFEFGDLLQLVNVDLFGEGVDIPAVQVVSLGRATASYGLYVQQFGRALRLLVSRILRAAWHTYTPAQRKAHIAASLKPYAIILDHVGAVLTHGGPPDWRESPFIITSRERKQKPNDAVALRYCTNPECGVAYERIEWRCPECGQEPPAPKAPERPKDVDGDIVLYTREMLEEYLGQKSKVDGPPVVPYSADFMVRAAVLKNHKERQNKQNELRAAMALVMPPTRDERTNAKKFFLDYGIDIIQAQGLGSTDAEKLRLRIIDKVTND